MVRERKEKSAIQSVKLMRENCTRGAKKEMEKESAPEVEISRQSERIKRRSEKYFFKSH